MLGGLLAGLVLPLEASVRGKDKKRKRKRKQRATAQAEDCWRAGACIPKKRSNVSQCDLAESTAFNGLDCTRCNISRANLRGADLRGANLTRANLSGACLVDADLSGAIVTNTTNLYNAIFCNTTMPDGSPNDSGCASGTACCPTCDAAHLCPSGCCYAGTCGACPSGQVCGGGNPGIPGVCGCTPTTCEAEGVTCGSIPDGCGGTLQCGICALGASPSCDDGTCASCAATCPAGCSSCSNLWNGSTFCGGGAPDCDQTCQTNADCDPGFVCALSTTNRASGSNVDLAAFCGLPAGTAVCRIVIPCS